MGVLKLEDICFRYRSDAPWAVDGVSLRVERGEILGLLGPNGAGKSTLLALMAGLLPADDGVITRDVEWQEPGGFALVPQEYAFYPMLTCRENLEFFAGVLGLNGNLRRERVRQAIATAGLERVEGTRVSACSGGLKRRLNLAIGLVGDPAVLLLDEPTVGVDPQSRAFLLDAIGALRRAGKAILYTSHYMEEVQAICDRVAIMDHGRLLCCGALGELLGQGGAELRIRVTRAPESGERGALQASFGLEANTVAGPDELVFSMSQGRRVEDVLARLREMKIDVSSIQYGCRHLEDLFLRLTHHSLRD